jgi:glycosidase
MERSPGLINKLPYLKSLGVTSIWITPPIDNVNNTDALAILDIMVIGEEIIFV